MKLLAASSFLILTSSICTSAADEQRPRHRRTKGNKGNKSDKEHPQCETIILNYAAYFNGSPCGNEDVDDNIKNTIGSTEWRGIYGPRITDEYFTSPIGIQFWSEQSVFNNDYPGSESEVEVAYPNPQEGWPGFYKLSAGFLLDPTGDIDANSTIYRSSIYYQEYSFENDKNADKYSSIMKSPITGGTGRYACANGELSFSKPEVFGPNGNEPKDRCSVVEYKLRVCNTCPDPDEWHDDDM